MQRNLQCSQTFIVPDSNDSDVACFIGMAEAAPMERARAL